MTTLLFTYVVSYLILVSHFDDVLASGEKHGLTWFKTEMPKKYELTVQVAGWENGVEREVNFPGRTVRLTQFGIELEIDEKHVKRMVE